MCRPPICVKFFVKYKIMRGSHKSLTTSNHFDYLVARFKTASKQFFGQKIGKTPREQIKDRSKRDGWISGAFGQPVSKFKVIEFEWCTSFFFKWEKCIYKIVF